MRPTQPPRGRSSSSSQNRQQPQPRSGQRTQSRAPARPTAFRRSDAIRLSDEVARKIMEGHPWVFSDALQGRTVHVGSGAAIDLLNTRSEFCGRALHDEGGSPLLRVFTRDDKVVFNSHYIANQIAAAAAWRQKTIEVAPQGFYRVFYGDVEGVPAVNVDRYGDYLVMALHSPMMAMYQEHITKALVSTWHPRGIYLQQRLGGGDAPERAKAGAKLIYGETAPTEVIVNEQQFRYAVDVSAPASPGVFPDMRLGRKLVAQLAGGRRVLNCFSYTGAFSCVAAMSGATSVVSVDTAERAHTRARRNFELNGLNGEDSNRFQFLTADTFAAIARFEQRKDLFDLIILDPPTFSNAKVGATFAVMRDYALLVKAALSILAPGGCLVACSNAAKLSVTEFERAIGHGAVLAKRLICVTERLGQSPDYPSAPGFGESGYLKIVCGHAVD